MNKIKNNLIIKTFASVKILALGAMLFAGMVKAQTCSGTASIPPSGTRTINGITVTSASTGFVTQYTSTFSNCSGANALSANSLWVGNNNNTAVADNGTWETVLTFSKPVNNIVIVLSATGGIGNEKFYFTSNGGAISISSTTNCFSTISGNSIFSGAGSPTGTTGGGGGIFRLTSVAPFTTLTMNGLGGYAGSLLGLCTSSIVACAAGNTAPILSGNGN